MTVVEMDIDVHIVASNRITHRRPQHLPAMLRWRAVDPWAVELNLGGRNPWVFGWELLVEAVGLPGRAGSVHGDIGIRRASPAVFEISLSSDTGTARLRVDAFDVAAFVGVVRPRQNATVPPLPDTAAALLALIDAAHHTNPKEPR